MCNVSNLEVFTHTKKDNTPVPIATIGGSTNRPLASFAESTLAFGVVKL